MPNTHKVLKHDVRSGIKVDEHGESWCYWTIFKRPAPRKLLRELLYRCYPVTGCGGNPGGAFNRKPWINRTKRRVLITQYGGMDI